ncbi:hypothetical protein PIB30_066112 [Stylosanthes scabra]|uniref:Uncharacterized protein n=1 Tax=Stylosanthes scabra TaxID=79078 RepID=A0ABU6UL27_9FABA|nr:hypothetical protein [Stylosanthes scabra]
MGMNLPGLFVKVTHPNSPSFSFFSVFQLRQSYGCRPRCSVLHLSASFFRSTPVSLPARVVPSILSAVVAALPHPC